MKSRSMSGGWTLAELLIVITIIAILAIMLLLMNWKRNIFRAHDVTRKVDVANIRKAFEEYFNDHDCFPDADVLATCHGAALVPYLSKIPCDPSTNEPYKYEPDSATNTCSGYRVCAKLQDHADPEIAAIGCDGDSGCGWGAEWNYCLATGTTVTASGFVPGSDVTPTLAPSPTPSYSGPYACRPGTIAGGHVVAPGTCNNVGDPAVYGCPRSFAEIDCQGVCGDSLYWCDQ